MQKAPSGARGLRYPASDNIKWQWASCISYMFLAVNKDVHKTAQQMTKHRVGTSP